MSWEEACEIKVGKKRAEQPEHGAWGEIGREEEDEVTDEVTERQVFVGIVGPL